VILLFGCPVPHLARVVGRHWHVERRSLSIYLQFKNCSSSEAAAMIEGVLRHCIEIAADRTYVDR
jgi:TnpA family transposase